MTPDETRHDAHVEFDGRSYYAWCTACDWHSPHRLAEGDIRERAADHERKFARRADGGPMTPDEMREQCDACGAEAAIAARAPDGSQVCADCLTALTVDPESDAETDNAVVRNALRRERDEARAALEAERAENQALRAIVDDRPANWRHLLATVEAERDLLAQQVEAVLLVACGWRSRQMATDQPTPRAAEPECRFPMHDGNHGAHCFTAPEPTAPDDLRVTPAVLGWSNPTTGPENLRLYATDKGKSPRWDGEHGRVVEQALREQGGTGEGDRYLVVRVGDRFTSDADMAAVMDVLHRSGLVK